MIEIGQYNELKILRETSVGLYLGDETGEDVLLPNKYCPESYHIDDMISVFVYRDYAERKIATNIIPKILLNEFALLQVTDVADVGAFLDWGLEKDLLVPFKEQRQNMEKGRWYVVYLDLDEKSYRLYASNKLDKFLDIKPFEGAVGDEVDLLIMHKTELGYVAIVNNANKGLIFHNEIFKELNIGEKMKGYVKQIRDDNKLDITLQPIGYEKFNDANSELVYNLLVTNNGFMPITDKSSPDDIYLQFGISKKSFKKALGALYKSGKVLLEDEGIRVKE